MIGKVNLICNLLIIGAICLYGIYKMGTILWELKEKREFDKNILSQNEKLKRILREHYENCDVYICYSKGISTYYIADRPMGIVHEYEVLYPIKGELVPGDFLNIKNSIEVDNNGSYLKFWTAFNKFDNKPVEIVFTEKFTENSNKIPKNHPYTRTTEWVGFSLPQDNDGYMFLAFLDMLKDIGWTKESLYPLSNDKSLGNTDPKKKNVKSP